MVSFKSVFTLGLVGSAGATCEEVRPGCGEVNIFFTGLPAHHPIVAAIGLNTTMVDVMLRRDAARVIAAGYNLKVVHMGPEIDMSVMEEAMQGQTWHGTGVGYGMRGSQRPDVTIRFEEVLELFRSEASDAPTMFNYNGDTFTWALQRRMPLASDCADSPGIDYGYDVHCDVCAQ
ncbi:hypothetical protein B0I35DRAFT_481924 [Stachybotrys elegans]|uniref:Uncharacterized protein n=1 Tax=Stachybotrys elegans TaxID=80388 RepID=A0A8K0SIN3_9HYPO|nr:hypothetical protein B0I35DRAFT_481924 [Stachybotrys elegans]